MLNTLDINSPITISKVGPDITSIAFNQRGGLMAYGNAKGEINFREIARKQFVKHFAHHSKAVQALSFIPGSTHLVAGGDDFNLSVCDFVSGRVVHIYKKLHSDFVRSVEPFAENPNMIISGSYDKTVRIYDIREPTLGHKLLLEHGSEVEDMQIYNNDMSLVTVGGKTTRIWDLRVPDTPIHSLSNNIKAITCVKVLEGEKRLLTASLDCHVKIYDLEEMNYILLCREHHLDRTNQVFESVVHNGHHHSDGRWGAHQNSQDHYRGFSNKAPQSSDDVLEEELPEEDNNNMGVQYGHNPNFQNQPQSRNYGREQAQSHRPEMEVGVYFGELAKKCRIQN